MELVTALYKSARAIAKQIPSLERCKEWRAWKLCRHWVALNVEQRSNSTFTGFLRLPTQFEALVGPVADYFGRQPGKHLRIIVMGCSNGAEAYTIASTLLSQMPDVDFLIDAYDINGDILEKARSACFVSEEVLNNRFLTDDFIKLTFDVTDDTYHVKRHIAQRVRFHIGDVLSPELAHRTERCDVLFAQNFLFHLHPKDAIRAFRNLCSLLKPRAVLFADGMDLGLRQRLTRIHGLVPLDSRIEEIHNEARRARAAGWPDRYWGLEPFMTLASDWRRRYATIFVKANSN
jgi:chemotaxis methyl-accepting protein methylase